MRWDLNGFHFGKSIERDARIKRGKGRENIFVNIVFCLWRGLAD